MASDLTPQQVQTLMTVCGHLEGYADVLSVLGTKVDSEGLREALREDATALEELTGQEES